MSLFDAFKPKWQNSNPDKRLEAIAELGADNQDVLERIAESDTDASVRIAAVKKLSIISTLKKISENDSDEEVKRTAKTRPTSVPHRRSCRTRKDLYEAVHFGPCR